MSLKEVKVMKKLKKMQPVKDSAEFNKWKSQIEENWEKEMNSLLTAYDEKKLKSKDLIRKVRNYKQMKAKNKANK